MPTPYTHTLLSRQAAQSQVQRTVRSLLLVGAPFEYEAARAAGSNAAIHTWVRGAVKRCSALILGSWIEGDEPVHPTAQTPQSVHKASASARELGVSTGCPVKQVDLPGQRWLHGAGHGLEVSESLWPLRRTAQDNFSLGLRAEGAAEGQGACITDTLRSEDA